MSLKAYLDSKKITGPDGVSARAFRVAEKLAKLGVIVNDANATLFTAAELDAVEAAFISFKRKMVEAPSILPLISTDSGAASYSYTVYDIENNAGQIADGVALTASDLTGTNASENIVQYRDSFTLSDQEVRQAALVGRPLETFGAQGVSANLQDHMDRVAMVGDGTLTGILNPSESVATYVVPADGTGSSALWATKTGDLILRDMTDTVDQVETASDGKHQADVLVMGADRLKLITAKKRTSAGGTDQTILQAFQQARPGVRVVGTYFMANTPVTVTTVAGKVSQRLVAFESEPFNLGRVVAMGPSILSLDVSDLVTRWQCKARCGGTVIRRPAAVCVALPASGGI